MCIRDRAEAHAPNIREQGLSRRSSELPAQVFDMDIDHITLGIELHVPHFLEKCRATHHFLGVQKEILGELKLLRREVEWPIIRCRHMAQPIQSDDVVPQPVSYTHLRAHETPEQLVCR